MLKEPLLLILWPSRFIEFATKETVKAEFTSNKQLKQSFPDEQLPPEKYKEFEERIRKSTNIVRYSFAVSFGWVLAAIIGGLILGQLLGYIAGSASKMLIAVLQLSAAGVLLGATLGLVGWEIQTFSGSTRPEKVNRFLYRALYIIGTGILAVSLSWPT